jgi:hypothetical protein
VDTADISAKMKRPVHEFHHSDQTRGNLKMRGAAPPLINMPLSRTQGQFKLYLFTSILYPNFQIYTSFTFLNGAI